MGIQPCVCMLRKRIALWVCGAVRKYGDIRAGCACAVRMPP